MKSDDQIMMPFKLITLAMIYVTCLIAANLGAVKLFSLGGLTMTSGIIMYPLTFLILDSMAEVWGKHIARRIVWIGLAANLLFICMMQAVIHLPPAPSWQEQSAYTAILGAMPRIVLASLSGYLVSQTLDVTLFIKLKQKTKGRKLWLRSILSTAISQLADSSVFMFIAFFGVLNVPTILTTIGSEYMLKFLYALIGAPLVYLAVYWVRGKNRASHTESRSQNAAQDI